MLALKTPLGETHPVLHSSLGMRAPVLPSAGKHTPLRRPAHHPQRLDTVAAEVRFGVCVHVKQSGCDAQYPVAPSSARTAPPR